MTFSDYCIKNIPEGIVLLESDGTFPLKSSDRVALLGRSQFEYLKGGTGSGGRINCAYVSNISGNLKDKVVLDKEVLNFYEKFLNENPYVLKSEWSYPDRRPEPVFTEEYIENLSKKNDKAIFIIGRFAGESYDCRKIKGDWFLSDEEERNIMLLSKYFVHFAVLINSGNIMDMSWTRKYSVKTVMYIWQGGQDGGKGTVDALLGINPPSGRLTDTIAKDISLYPSTDCFGDENENIHKEDIFVGYRYFETFDKDGVLYPFGYGIGYTQFVIGITQAEKNGDTINIGVKVDNVGNYKGKEVVQIYFSAPSGTLGKPSKELIAFRKTDLLERGESQSMRISFSVSDMACFDDSGKSGYAFSYVLEKGRYKVYAGKNVRDVEKVFEFDIDRTILVEKCTSACATKRNFLKMTERNGELCYENAADAPSFSDKQVSPVPEIGYTGDKNISFADVESGKNSVAEFTAQFSAEELSYLVKGEGMSSPKASLPGTAACFGGVASVFAKKGVPVITACDGPAGLRIECGIAAHCIPIGTMIACSWAPQLFGDMFSCFADELIENGIDVNLGPGMNIHRNPLCGRNFEYFSEDPLLTGAFANMIAESFKKKGIFNTLKHFAVNSQETSRGKENEILTERALREIYLKAFKMVIKSGNACSIMTAFNKINGLSCASSSGLIAEILRREWGFDGIVMTDWWARIDDSVKGGATAQNLTAMVDAQTNLYMVVPDAVTYCDDLSENLKNGRLTLGMLQRCAMEIFTFALKTRACKNNRVYLEENRLSAGKTVFETNDLRRDILPHLPEKMYFAEIEYAICGNSLEQHTVHIFVDESDPITLILNGTDGLKEKARFKIYLSDESKIKTDAEFVSAFKVLEISNYKKR